MVRDGERIATAGDPVSWNGVGPAPSGPIETDEAYPGLREGVIGKQSLLEAAARHPVQVEDGTSVRGTTRQVRDLPAVPGLDRAFDLCAHSVSDVGPDASVAGVGGRRVSGGVVHPLPADLRTALLANPSALELWNACTPLGRNEFICWVEEAKQQKTRERRIRRTQEELEDGMKRPCCWPGCKHRVHNGKADPLAIVGE